MAKVLRSRENQTQAIFTSALLCFLLAPVLNPIIHGWLFPKYGLLAYFLWVFLFVVLKRHEVQDTFGTFLANLIFKSSMSSEVDNSYYVQKGPYIENVEYEITAPIVQLPAKVDDIIGPKEDKNNVRNSNHLLKFISAAFPDVQMQNLLQSYVRQDVEFVAKSDISVDADILSARDSLNRNTRDWLWEKYRNLKQRSANGTKYHIYNTECLLEVVQMMASIPGPHEESDFYLGFNDLIINDYPERGDSGIHRTLDSFSEYFGGKLQCLKRVGDAGQTLETQIMKLITQACMYDVFFQVFLKEHLGLDYTIFPHGIGRNQTLLSLFDDRIKERLTHSLNTQDVIKVSGMLSKRMEIETFFCNMTETGDILSNYSIEGRRETFDAFVKWAILGYRSVRAPLPLLLRVIKDFVIRYTRDIKPKNVEFIVENDVLTGISICQKIYKTFPNRYSAALALAVASYNI